MLIPRPYDQCIALVTMAVGFYGHSNEAGHHCPVYRVLSQAIAKRLWGVGLAQTRSMLKDPFSRRMMTLQEEDALKAALAGFELLADMAHQEEATWSYNEGAWVMTTNLSTGFTHKDALGAYLLHDPNGVYGPPRAVQGVTT